MSLIDLTPAGTVNMGSNCSVKFNAKINDNLFDSIYWFVQCTDPNSNLNIGSSFGIGSTSTDTIEFSLNHNQLLSLAINGKLGFYVTCIKIYQGITYPSPLPNGTYLFLGNSNTVIMDFTGSSCAGLYSVSLNPSSFIGGDSETDKAVTITVTLDTVAPPGGREVTLAITSGSNVARFVAGNTFVIPQGQQSESLSWFLGTKKKNEDFQIRASIDSINNSIGYVNGTVTKK